MKKDALAIWLMLCSLCLLASTRVHAETAHSLDQVPSLLKTPEAKKVFKEQMEGAPAPDKLGIHLPAGLSAKAVAALILPAGDKAPLNTVGVKPLPDQQDLFAAIVCTGGDAPTSPADMQCGEYSTDTKPPLKAYLGVIEAKPGSAPKLVAKPILVNGMVDWGETGLPDAPDAAGDEITPTQYESFDLAPYWIAKDQRAFGLRGTWTDSYSGGMASYSALYLFAVVDGALKRIFAAPMSSYKDLAGDWHKDGTRDHHITQGANVLIVTKRSSSGHFDLLLKSRTGHWQRLYQWAATAATYRPQAVQGKASH